MKISLKRINDNYLFETVNERGNIVLLDNKSDAEPKGSSPMDLILRGIAGCSSIDVVMILKKQQHELEDLQVEVEGFREDGAIPNVFNKIHLNFIFKGEVPAAKVERAVKLSMDKYCSVSKMLEKAATISYSIELNSEKIL
ncbi:OsmC family protein [Christiangramia forsetii]|uniref:OsmC-like protein n=2 Tax=Christiangramia forsetii TaxID=411153 RepID=A0LY72_CHRFK|nr:OsmC family protein [Christiangramia forsetii]GGG34875.1 osmotically inducible protein C [Christiangramia forsetii]CAL65317.1 OsmC-like protein [Christiangramia forsetii KT0803]